MTPIEAERMVHCAFYMQNIYQTWALDGVAAAWERFFSYLEAVLSADETTYERSLQLAKDLRHYEG